MIAARFIVALDDLATALLAAFPAPTVVAEGSAQGNVPRESRREGLRRTLTPAARARFDAVIESYRPLPRGLVPCSTCGTEQRPGAVHFATLRDIRPCVGSWRRR